MESRIYGYARVSSQGQNLARQIDKLQNYVDPRNIITEKKSGKNVADRPEYLAMRDHMLRAGDTLMVCSLDRLGRNKSEIKRELEHFKENNIKVKVLDLPTTLTDFPEGQQWVGDMVNNILIEVLGSIAEQERLTIRERQKEGIEAARKAGNVTFGRPKAVKPDNWDEVYAQWKTREITGLKAMELTGLSKTTFYKFVKEEKKDISGIS